MKKIVLKLDLHDDKAKQKALKTVSTLRGIDSIAMDMKEKKLTVTGIVDPVSVVSKLRKYWPATTIMLLGPAKEPEKPEEKKEEGAKQAEQGKKEDGQASGGSGGGGGGGGGENPKKGGEEAGKKEGSGGGGSDEGKKEDQEKIKPPLPPPDPVLELVKAYKAYNPHMTTYYYVPSMEENPNACTIC